MSPQKHAAQIANAHLSTGPRTSEGKARSSRNNTRHGFCSENYRVGVQDRPEFERLYTEMIEALAPEGAVEMQLAEAVITDIFRISRIKNVENDIFTQGLFQSRDELFAAADTWSARAKEFALLTLYEQRINRQLTRNKQELEARQAARKTCVQPADPGVGFVHSPAVPAAEGAAPVPSTSTEAVTAGGFVRSPAAVTAEAGIANSRPLAAGAATAGGFVHSPMAPSAQTAEAASPEVAIAA